MKIWVLTSLLITLFARCSYSQVYPAFGNEIAVNINGLTFDAMEPFISLDGNTLFFNSLNAGGNTNLYYATKVNDSTFNYVGFVNGTYDPSPNHLDAVASLDSLNNFFWTTLRNYPTPMENLHRGLFSNGAVSNITRVYGDFNILSFNFPFGWLIMDAAIHYQGHLLYYCNAKFDFSNTSCAGIPCESKIGVAEKVNDSTFAKLASSDAIFSFVNDTLNYLIYAPQVTKDGLELYYTRLMKNTVNTEICVSVRTSVTDTFSVPVVIHSNQGFIPEAATITTNKQLLYYHQKDVTGIFRIYLRYRAGTVGVNEHNKDNEISLHPNPSNNFIYVTLPDPNETFSITLFSSSGTEIFKSISNTFIDISALKKGIYFISVMQNEKQWVSKFVKD